MNNRESLGSTKASRPWRQLAALTAMLLLAAYLAVSHLWSSPSGPNQAATQTATATANERGDFHYLRSGQWLADLRTLVAACRYVLEPEPA
jgi:hypothetical protein